MKGTIAEIEVHVVHGQSNTKGDESQEQQLAPAEQERQLWALCCLGCIFMPAWWAGVIQGLIWKRRGSKLTTPWWLCLLLSLSAIVILVVVLPVKLRSAGTAAVFTTATPGKQLTSWCCGHAVTSRHALLSPAV